jgi:hypothetical protein
VRCAECGTLLAHGQDREVTDGGTFCRRCFEELTAQLRHAIADQGRDVNWALAAVGAIGGGALGIAVWWGFTVLTGIAFGLVAVVIGFAVGRGALWLSGGKRSRGLQILSVGVAAASFFVASYLVNRTLLLRAAAEQGTDLTLPLVPEPELVLAILQAGFNVMDLVFLAIVVWEAWKIPAPVRLEQIGGPS